MSRSGRRLFVALAAGCALVPAGSAAAHVSTTPNSYAFGGQTVGTSSAPATFTLNVRCIEDPANPGSGMCQQPGGEPFTPNVTVSGNFAIRNNNCTSMMPGNTTFGTNCTFGVIFAPPATGYQTGIVDVGDPNGFGKAAVNGTGLAPALPVLPATTGAQTPGKKKKCKRRRGGGKAAAAKKCRRKKR